MGFSALGPTPATARINENLTHDQLSGGGGVSIPGHRATTLPGNIGKLEMKFNCYLNQPGAAALTTLPKFGSLTSPSTDAGP